MEPLRSRHCSCLDSYIVNSVKCGIIDGNKRVALQAASVLLQINGYYLVASQVERKITFSMVMNVYTKEIAVIVFIVVSILLFAITSYIRANKTLSEREARYHALMEQSSEALAVVNIETREIVEVNRQYTELFGYSLPEDSPLYVSKVIVEPEHTTDNRYTKMLKDQRLLPMETITFRHKNGTKVLTERGGTVVTLDGRDYLLASMRDMTEERRREAEVAQDVELAKWVQLELLPDLPVSPHFTLRSLYFPSHGISGDSYQVEWKSEGNILRGFLLDVSGHGVSTALQSASVSVLLREAVTANTSLQEQVQQVNIQASKYFVEGSYAALLAFELDFSRRELRYVGAGITRFYHNGRDILTPGMLVGLLESAQYTTGVLPVETGDCLHFLTDGFTDVLAQPEHAGFWSPDGKDFATDVASLERLAEGRGLRDDASGICLVINAFS